MLKRQRSDSSELQHHQALESPDSSLLPPPPAAKRQRPLHLNNFNKLSDELVVKILSYLAPSELTRAQRVCHRFYRIAGDDQIWKSAFYERFVLPRVSRLPGVIRAGGTSSLPAYSSRRSKWLEDEGLAKTQNANWKRQYRIRHNWNQGTCGVDEIDISNSAGGNCPEKPFFVKMRGVREGSQSTRTVYSTAKKLVFTIDGERGIQAWRTEGEQKFVAEAALDPELGIPSTLAIDDFDDTESSEQYGNINIAIGFDSGRFSIHRLDISNSRFHKLYTHSKPNSTATITSLSLSGAHIAIMNRLQMFTVYSFGHTPRIAGKFAPPTEVASLKSHTVWPPVSTTIRKSAQGICACIVYALPTYTIGWSVGMQELWLSGDGKSVARSRIASAVPAGFQSASSFAQEAVPHAPFQNFSPASASRESSFPGILSQPTAFSYSHPYLLATQNDNTLTLYVVKSTAENLEITPGQRLWGHTSAVSTAHIGSRGRAVSISSRGAELRIWELEGLSQTRKGRESIRVYPSPSKSSQDSFSTSTVGNGNSWWESSARDRWLGFDEEKVVVHREKESGKHALVVYNFA